MCSSRSSFCVHSYVAHRDLHSFPTRRSSDPERLERMGASVKGAIVIARYFGSWRGIKPTAPCSAATLGLMPRHDPKRSEEHTSELQSHSDLVCRPLLEKKK